MTLGASATHALRALACLAAGGGEAPILGRTLAAEVRVPAPYLAKVLAALARAGVLTASRGVRGGYRLARPARRIKLMEIVEPFEGLRARPGCLLRPGEPCRTAGGCSAHAAWSRVKTAHLAFLEATTLADIQGLDRGQSRRRGGPRPRAPRPHRGSFAVWRTRA